MIISKFNTTHDLVSPLCSRTKAHFVHLPPLCSLRLARVSPLLSRAPPQQLPGFWLFIKPKEFEQTLKQLAMAAYCVVIREYQNILSPTRVTKVKGM